MIEDEGIPYVLVELPLGIDFGSGEARP